MPDEPTARPPAAPAGLYHTPFGDPGDGDTALAEAVGGRLLGLAAASTEFDLCDSACPVPPAGYVIDRELARGGMGVVYLARQVALNRPVALKMVLGSSPTDLVRFLAEAEAAAAIDHPNVVRVLNFGQTAGRPYLAMEYLPGGTLAAKFAAGKQCPWVAATVLHAVAAGVAAAHAAGVVHRDSEAGQRPDRHRRHARRSTDFGLAKQLSSDGAESERADAHRCHHGHAQRTWPPSRPGGRPKRSARRPTCGRSG